MKPTATTYAKIIQRYSLPPSAISISVTEAEGTLTDGYEAWWNVGLAETSEKEEVRKAWKNVEKGRRESRAY